MGSSSSIAQADEATRGRLGLQALDRFLETWNARDAALWSTSLHFPHVRPSPGRFELTDTREEYEAGVDFAQTLATGWRYTRWVDRQVLQVGLDRVHVAGHWRRCLEDGTPQVEALVTYVVTERGGRWRIQARFAAGRVAPEPDPASSDRALEAVHAFVQAMNSHDPERLADAVHYPHVRLADGAVSWWESRASFVQGPEPGRQRTWTETRIERAHAVQVTERGANVALAYARLSPSGKVLTEYEAVYLVTLRNGAWKVQARSTLGT